MRFKLLAVAVVGLLVAAEGKKDKPKKDAERILGTWNIVSAETGGSKEDDDKIKDGTLTFAKDGKGTLKLPDQNVDLTYELDAAKKPGHITFTADDRTFRGIYKFEGDKLTVCVGEPDSDSRPTKFATEAGTMMRLTVLKRAKK